MVARSQLFTFALASATGLGALACTPEGELSGDGLDGRRDATSSQAASGVGPGGALSGGGRYPLSVAPQVWAERQKLLADDGAPNDLFGRAISLSGDTALIGSLYDDDNGGNTGSAYLFTRNAATWVQAQKLVADDGAANDYFGSSVSLSGDIALIGARADGDKGEDAGSAYVFMRSATTWVQAQKLLADDGAAYDGFGRGVSVSGDTALIAASGDDDNGDNAGSAYLFIRSATTWTQVQKLVADDGAARDSFGSHVSLSGDAALIGAPGDDDKGADAGSAYVFMRSATTWVQAQKLLADDGAAYDGFGRGVSVSGDAALIGASGDDDKGNLSGSAYIFMRSAATWVQAPKLVPDAGATDDVLGSSVSLSGDMGVIGAPGDDDMGYLSGSVYVFALRSVNGEPCAGDEACTSKFCVDGVCCASACGGACEACDVGGLEGVCTLAVRGSVPSASCPGYLCNGTTGGCASNCASDEDCGATYYCASALACAAKKAEGKLCDGNNVCLSGHCVDGICCANACDEGCGSCVAPGLEGACTPLERGHSGSPVCAPFLCDGGDVSCPDACQAHGDCAQGAHCDGGRCQLDTEPGAACAEDDACATGHCTDGLCCLVDGCGAYRCGSGGICQTSCSSSAQCAEGQQCSSADKCEPVGKSAGGAGESGSCHLASISGVAHQPLRWRWVGAFALLAWSGLARRRRRGNSWAGPRAWRSSR